MSLALLFTAFMLGACTARAEPEEDSSLTNNEGQGDLLVGLLVPESGVGRERGEAMRNGATLAVEAINVAGGVHGAKMALTVVESAPDPQSLVRSFSTLAGRTEIPAVMTSSEDDIAVLKGLAELHGTLLLANSIRGDFLKAGGLSIRIGRPNREIAAGLLSLAKDRRVNRIAVIRGEEAWAYGAQQGIERVAKEGNIQLSSLGAFWNEKRRPSERALAKLRTGNPELLCILASGEEQREIFDALRASLIKVPVVAPFVCGGIQKANSTSGYEGSIYSLEMGIDQTSPSFIEMKERFAQRFPKLQLTVDSVIAYDIVHLIAQGYRAGAGLNMAMRDFIVSQEKLQGASGSYAFSKDGDILRRVDVSSVHDGECRQIAGR